MTKWTRNKLNTLRENPNDYPWDDLQVSINVVKGPGVSDPTWTTWDFGLGGPAFAVLRFDTNDAVDFYIQTTHSMKLKTVLENHVHWLPG